MSALSHSGSIGPGRAASGHRDGGHKLDRVIRATLGQRFELVPVCPEEELGLGIPREPIHLAGDPARPRLVTVETGIDLTGRMLEFCRRRARELEPLELCGYIFKSKSPSCGVERVKVYDDQGMAATEGVGLWARTCMEHFPFLPAVEEAGLHDLPRREEFIRRVQGCHAWRRESATERPPEPPRDNPDRMR